MKYRRVGFLKWLGRGKNSGTAILALPGICMFLLLSVCGVQNVPADENEPAVEAPAEETGQDTEALEEAGQDTETLEEAGQPVPEPRLRSLYEANQSDALIKNNDRYDRSSIFFYPDGSSRRVYSFRSQTEMLRLQEDMAVVVGEAGTRAFRRDPQTWEWTEWEIRPQDWPDFVFQIAGGLVYDPDEVVDLSVQVDQYLHIESSADVILHFPLLEQLGLKAGGEDWIACTYDVDPDTLEIAVYTAALMHPDGTSDPLNTITFRYGASVPEEEPLQSIQQEGIPLS